MDRNSTRFLTSDKIDVKEIDLFADAFGIVMLCENILNIFANVSYIPDDKVVMKIITDL